MEWEESGKEGEVIRLGDGRVGRGVWVGLRQWRRGDRFLGELVGL